MAYLIDSCAPPQACGTYTLGGGLYIANPPPISLTSNASEPFHTTQHNLTVVVGGTGGAGYYPYQPSDNLTIAALDGTPITNGSYTPGQQYLVTVTTTYAFHGFLVGADAEKDNAISGGDISVPLNFNITNAYGVGAVASSTVGELAHQLQCPNSKYVTQSQGINLVKSSPVTHTGAYLYYSFSLIWTAPNPGAGTIKIGAAVVFRQQGPNANTAQGAIFLSTTLNEILSAGVTSPAPNVIVNPATQPTDPVPPTTTAGAPSPTTTGAGAITTGAGGVGTVTTGPNAVTTSASDAGIITTNSNAGATTSAGGSVVTTGSSAKPVTTGAHSAASRNAAGVLAVVAAFFLSSSFLY